MSIRTERVGKELQKALARPLSDLASEISAGFLTVTTVRMSPDLRLAKVYISLFGGKISPAQAMTLIETRAKEIRRTVASAIRLRYMPELRFFLDDTLDVMNKVENLLQSLPPTPSIGETGNPEQ